MTDASTPRAGCGCGPVDMHTHVVPADFPAYLGSRKGVPWPSMVPAAAPCHRHVVISGEVYRTVSHQCWDPAVRQADMDAMGVGVQVLSPMPELLSYWLAPEDGSAMCRFLNESVARLVQSDPARFVGLGAVPLQSVDAAVAELEHAVRVLGMAGVEIGSNIDGVPIGHPRFAPFFEAAAALDAAVFVHALRPAGMDRLVGPPQLEQVLAFPGEVGLAAASMITGGTLARCPTLRIAFSHGGGSLPVLLPRLQHGFLTVPQLRDQMQGRSPLEAARGLWFDDLVYDAPAIANLLRVYGDTQVMIGTDYPFAIMDREPLARLDALGLDAAAIERLRSGNALRWLGQRAAVTAPTGTRPGEPAPS